MTEAREAILLLVSGVCQQSGESDDTRNTTRPAREDYSVESHFHDVENHVIQYCIRHHRCRHLNPATGKDDLDSPLSFFEDDANITEPISKDDDMWFENERKRPTNQQSPSSNLSDMQDEAIRDLVRNRLYPALKAVLSHGLRKSKVIGGERHPWLFVQEVAEREEKEGGHTQNEFCRQMLCRNYSLEEDDCNVPTPGFLLRQAVQAIQPSHDLCRESIMDDMLLSLLCYGLREGVLHLWLEWLVSCRCVVTKWYRPCALLNSPAWVTLKCQLRLLSFSSFPLDDGGKESSFPREDDGGGGGSVAAPRHALPQGIHSPLPSAPEQPLFSWDF